MPFRQLLVLGALAIALSGVASRSAPAADTASWANGAVTDDSYLLHARFSLRYSIEWLEASGSDTDCTWRVDSGRSTVQVDDAAWKRRGARRKGFHGLPGRIEIFDEVRPSLTTGGWASGSALGKAKVSVLRRWTQRGGVNPDRCNVPPKPFQASPTDCGERAFTTGVATMLAQLRLRMDTLEYLMFTPTPRDVRRAGGSNNAVAFSIPPGRGALYRKCRTSNLAPELPTNLGFKVVHVDELKGIQPGQTAVVEWGNHGPCDDQAESPTFSCRFDVDLELKIFRWDPKTPYP